MGVGWIKMETECSNSIAMGKEHHDPVRKGETKLSKRVDTGEAMWVIFWRIPCQPAV